MLKTPYLRIISGKFKGQRLVSPASLQTHPMGSREKLALFNMVSVKNAKVLDLYAGSGALGIEALSRGAAEAVFVENYPKAAATIKSNLSSLGLKSPVYVTSVAKFSQNPVFQAYFDVIFADPPYDALDPEEIFDTARLLQPGGYYVLSAPADRKLPDFPKLSLISSHHYAAASLIIYQKSPK